MADIEIKRGYEVLPDNNVRFGIRITNAGDVVISDVEVILDYVESLFKLEGDRLQKVGNIPPANTRTAEFVLKPLGCVHNVNIEATIFYRDSKWDKHIETMHPKEVHCVCPFLKGKAMPRAEFLKLSGSGHSAETGLNFKGVSVDRLASYLVQTCKNRHHKVDDFSVDSGRMLYLASESIGEKAYYLLTALIKEDGGLTQVMLKAVSDKSHGLNGFLNETVAELRHVVSTVQSAQEIGFIKNEQVINIIDSVVQRSSFGGVESSTSVNIDGSVVHGAKFNADEDRKAEEELLRKKEREEQKRLENERIEKEKLEKLRRQKEEEEERLKKEQEEKDELERVQKKAQEQAEKERKAREEQEEKKQQEELRKKEDEEKEILRKQEVQRKAEEEAEKERKEKERIWQEKKEKKRQDELRKKQEDEKERLRKQEAQRKEQEKKAQAERERIEHERKAKEEMERKAREIDAKEKQKAREKEERIAKKKSNARTNVLILVIVLVGFVMYTPYFDNLHGISSSQAEVVSEPIEPTSSQQSEVKPEVSQTPALSSNQKTSTNSIGMEFVLIPAGEFKMGSPSSEEGRSDREGALHKVKIEKAYYLGKYEVTQKQWRDVMGDNPSSFKGDDLPVEKVSWYDVQEFIEKLNQKEGTNKYRLPSEAEWEYAARAGTTTRYSFGDGESKLGEYAWYYDNSGDKTHPVGQKKPNSWGLYDMHGNVWEWVQDDWHGDYDGAPSDGSAWESGDGSSRVDRGGGWRDLARFCRSALRVGNAPGGRYGSLGFRLLQEP